MNRVFVSFSAIPLLFCCVVLSPRHAAAQDFGRVVYTCPPCGCPGDTVTAETAGVCAVCGMPMVEKSELTNVAVLIYDGVQLADFAGAYSVFEAARTFDVYTVAATDDPVRTYLSPVSITPKYSFSSCPKPDILIIPGGGVGSRVRDQEFIRWVRDRARGSRIVLSVCTGAFILAKTGLIDGLSSTVLEEDLAQLERAAPEVNVVSGKRFVDNGKFLSARGPASGIDAGLHIISRIFGNERRAREIAKFLDYEWSAEQVP